MHRTHAAVLSAATLVAAVGLSACGSEPPPAAAPAPPITTLTPPTSTQPAPDLPPPSALTDVLYKLADTSIPGVQKVALVEYATADEADHLNKFGQALSDSGINPVNFEASELTWSGKPGNVVAIVTIRSPSVDADLFTFPMEFNPTPDGWQLTRQTADLLLQASEQRTAPPPR